jgi:signal peptidase I
MDPNLLLGFGALLLAAVLVVERLLRARNLAALRNAADWSRSMLPILLLIFGGRAFAYEPMRVPSGSMTPTLLTGDFILVDKRAYGMRNPLDNSRWSGTGMPARGDVVVFRYPRDHSQRYVKRVVGLPGDVVEMRDGELILNGRATTLRATGQLLDTGSPGMAVLRRRSVEDLGDRKHPVLRCINDCAAGQRGRWVVPAGRYFVMGDNRDNSADSRYWGFVDDAELGGRAVRVWFHFKPFGDDWGLRGDRIGVPVG